MTRFCVAAVLLSLPSCHDTLLTTTSRDPAVDRGKAAIERYGCASCHTIPGIAGAEGLVGPSLARVASRTYIAGVLVNTPDNIEQWIADPPRVDSKTAMPNLRLSEQDVKDIRSFLLTLK
jgi:cytochrome c1